MGLRTAIGAAALGLWAGCADYDEATTSAGPVTTMDARPGDTDDGDTDPDGKMDQPGGGTSDAVTTDPVDDDDTTATDTDTDPSGDGSDGGPPGPPPPMVDPNGPYGRCSEFWCADAQSQCQWVPGELGQVCSPWCGSGGTNVACPAVAGYETECAWETGSCFITCGQGCPPSMSCNPYGHCVWQ